MVSRRRMWPGLRSRSKDRPSPRANGVCNQVPTSAIESRFVGWRALIGFDNYVDIFTNRRIQEPFLRVFAWNIVFAFSSVILTFAMGLMLAIALQDEAMRGRALYRSIYIIPYAIPGFLSILIWRGLLNDRFGKVNGVLESVGFPDQTGWEIRTGCSSPS